MGINIAQVVRHWAIRDPQRVAVVTTEGAERRELSFGELDLRARRAASMLAAQGVVEGTRVAISLQNGLGFLDAWFGGLYQGATLLPIPPMSAPPELAYRLQHARCALLIHDESTRALSEQALAHASLLPCAPGDAPRHTRTLAVDALGQGDTAHDGPRDLQTNAVAMVLYTSGTTGTPKGAMISHASLFTHTAALVHHVLTLSPHDVVLACLPLTHSYGIRMTLLAPFYAGAHIVLLPRFQTQCVQETLRSEQVSWFPGVPTMFHALAHAQRSETPSLRWCLSAGAPLPADIRVRAEQALGAPVRQGFGLTEATFTSIALPDDQAGADSVGRPVFGVEVRIVGEQGEPLGPHMAGEVCVRGQNVMMGYLDDEQATRDALRDGWLHSGDVGTLDEQGRLRIVDRIKDKILRGGFNVYPAEVEAVLVSHPAIFDAVVVGLADERYGEEVVAVIVQRAETPLDNDELATFCRARLSSTKLPRLLGKLAALPVGPSGKVQRRVVRDEVQQGKIVLTRLAASSGSQGA
jgi:long-chain acyl-CoA synthetase